MTFYIILWLAWWLSGVALAWWGWTEEFDQLDVSAAVLSLLYCTILGPIVGLLWWPSNRPLWRRKRCP